VAAFGTVPAEVLFGVYEARRKAKRPSLVYCGDDRRGKDVVATLIRRRRFRSGGCRASADRPLYRAFKMLIARLATKEKRPGARYRFERYAK